MNPGQSRMTLIKSNPDRKVLQDGDEEDGFEILNIDDNMKNAIIANAVRNEGADESQVFELMNDNAKAPKIRVVQPNAQPQNPDNAQVSPHDKSQSSTLT